MLLSVISILRGRISVKDVFESEGPHQCCIKTRFVFRTLRQVLLYHVGCMPSFSVLKQVVVINKCVKGGDLRLDSLKSLLMILPSKVALYLIYHSILSCDGH